MSNLIRQLSQLLNISDSYTDKMGKIHYTKDSLRKTFLTSMGYDVSSNEKVKQILNNEKKKIIKNGLDYVYSFFDNEKLEFDLYIPKSKVKSTATFIFYNDNKEVLKTTYKILTSNIIEEVKNENKTYVKIKIKLKEKLSPNYYTLKIEELGFESFIIIAPRFAYLPPSIEKGEKLLGLGLQLYSLKSKTSMGIGDFSNLKEILKLSHKYGCDSVGINPLGAMYFKSKKDVSPYRTLSREYFNYIYLDLTVVEDFKKSLKIQKIIKTKKYQMELSSLNTSKYINYEKVFKFKLSLLYDMYKYFKGEHIKNNTTRAKSFFKFKEQEGISLENLCTFETILENEVPYWKNWKNNLNNINSKELKKYKLKNKDKINFYAYTHWLCHLQLLDIKKLSQKLKMKVGLYLDIPVGAASNGAEVWQSPISFANDIDIGTPPDSIRPKGQTWGLIPPNPIKLKQTHYATFINLIKNNMRYANAIRLDHSFSLMRLFWVDKNKKGAYVNYNLKDMTAILCLESHKNKSLVIGEDLGNIPNGFSEFMASHKILSNKILFRQKDKKGKFIQVDKYPYLSLCQVSTHDQATSYGFWLNEDININNKCNLFPKQSQYQNNLSERNKERKDIVRILKKTSSFYNNEISFKRCLDGKNAPLNLEYSFNIYGAKTQSAIFQVKMADIYQQIEMENVPSTVDEYPNWRIKYPIYTENITNDKRMEKLFSTLKKYRK